MNTPALLLLTGAMLTTSALAQTQSAPRPLSPALRVTRLNNNQPIITRQMFLDIDASLVYDGKNVNGPCMVRIPDWVAKEDRASSYSSTVTRPNPTTIRACAIPASRRPTWPHPERA